MLGLSAYHVPGTDLGAASLSRNHSLAAHGPQYPFIPDSAVQERSQSINQTHPPPDAQRSKLRKMKSNRFRGHKGSLKMRLQGSLMQEMHNEEATQATKFWSGNDQWYSQHFRD